MTYSVLGIETIQVRETDPRTGKQRLFYLPKVNQQTGKEEKVRLPKSSRLQGTYIIGATGAGKTGLVKNLSMQDIRQGIGVCVLDPHGDLINDIIAGLSDDEVQRVILLDIEDTDYQGTDYYPGLNIYQCDDPADDDLVTETQGRIEHLFDVVTLENSEEKLGVRVSQGIRNSAYTFIDSSPVYGCTMLELPMLFQEDVVRAKLASHLIETDTTVKDYWKKYEGFDRFEKVSRADMVVNKIEGYIINRKLRRIIGQSRTTINFREVMDCRPGKIVLVKLPGDNEGMTELLGKMLIAQLLAAAMSRRNIPRGQRKQFHIYCDEFELYASDDFTRLLKECRKYGMAVTIAHQSRDFIDLKNKAASLQVANLIVLRTIRKDADEVAGNFDCTPIRTKKVPKRRTKSIFYEWDEDHWDSEEAEKQAQELKERLAEAKQNAEEASRKREQAHLHEIGAQMLAQHLRNAFGDKDYTIAWCNQYSLSELLHMAKTYQDTTRREEILAYLYQPFTPCWLQADGQVKDYDFWLAYRELLWGAHTFQNSQHSVENNLPLVQVKSETVHDSFYAWPEWQRGRTKDKDKKLVSYTYQQRTEWYSFTGEAAVSGLEYTLRKHPWPKTYKQFSYREADVAIVFKKLLEEFIIEVHASLLRVYEGTLFGTPGCNCRFGGVRLQFTPRLAPYKMENGFHRYLELPSLAQEDHPPEIGQHWKYRDWMSCGKWEMERNPAFADWLVRTVSRLEKLVDECRIQAELADQEEVQSRQQLAHLTKEWEAFQNLHFTPIHHKDYLGEQPEVEEQERISHSYSQGESETVSYSRMGTSHGYGTSKSYSTSHSTADVQWYDLVDELDQTHAQRQDEIANEIASQPDYIARVKIKDENDELVEYTTRTLKPEPGLRGRALEERLLQIKETMIGQNIIRPKHVIDEEIKKRQQALRQPMLEPPHKQRTLPPPEDEPPITRRR